MVRTAGSGSNSGPLSAQISKCSVVQWSTSAARSRYPSQKQDWFATLASSSYVFLVHRPTGLSVKGQRERPQTLSRILARRLLLDRIERVQMGLRAEEKVRQEKNRRQKRRRSKKAQNKDLFEKHRQTEKKISYVSKRAKLKE